METLKIKIVTGNDAFGETDENRNLELGRILRRAADRIEIAGNCGQNEFGLHDLNGNTVGNCTIA